MSPDWIKEIARRYEAAFLTVTRRMNVKLRELIGEGNITAEQFSIMRYLLQHERSTSSELADSFCVGKSSITAIVTRLADKNLVVREPDERDRRVVYLMLSEEGKQLCSVLEDKVHEILAWYIDPIFDKEEAFAFIETLEKLSNRMRND